jgi:SAM-dependent methyltransferase
MALVGELRNCLGGLVVDRVLAGTHWGLRRQLMNLGARVPAAPPDRAWAQSANAALLRRSQVDAAIAEVGRCGLPEHPTPEKNWDFLIALSLLDQRVAPGGRILDAGAPTYSVLLPWAFLLGYDDLWGIDLAHTRPVRRGPIRYEHGDLTQTRFEDGSFDAVTCMSVIEHGVDPQAYFREMRRLIKPGGLLITSTDYWRDPIDTRGEQALGVDVRIFDRATAGAMIEVAEAHGFQLTGEIDLSCEDRVVSWSQQDLDYTFLIVAMQRGA